MKIAVLTSGLLPVPALQGGAVENLIDYYLHFNEKEKLHEITVISVMHQQIPPQFLKKNTNHTHYVHLRTDKNWYKIKRKLFGLSWKKTCYYNYYIEYYLHRALQLIKKNDFDVIILENRPGYAEKVARAAPESRIVLHLHNDFLSPDIADASKIKSFLSSTITVSDYIKSRVDAVPPFKPSYTCYNGIDLDHFQSNGSIVETRNKLQLATDDFVVIFSGRLIPEKGVKELLYAMQYLNDLNIKLLIVGGNFFGNDIAITDYMNDLHSFAEEYVDRIIFTGFRSYEEMPHLLKCADICVIPSIWEEPFSMSCVEAMASGLPLIVTRSGGMKELVNEQCALILDVSPDLPKRIADSILDLYDHREKRELMSVAAIERSKLFSKERYAGNFMQLLDS